MLRFILSLLPVLLFAVYGNHVLHYLVWAGLTWIQSTVLVYSILIINILPTITGLISSGKSYLFQDKIKLITNLSVFILTLLIWFKIPDNELVVFIVLLGLTLLFYFLTQFFINQNRFNSHPIKLKLNKHVVMITAFILTIVSAVLIKVPYINEYTLEEPGRLLGKQDQAFIDKVSEKIDLSAYRKSDDLFLVFFTTTCPHCKRIAQLIESTRRSGSVAETIAIVGGDEESVHSFIDKTSYSGKYISTLDDNWFYSLTAGIYPLIVRLTDNKVTGVWGGGTFNYSALDKHYSK